VKIAALRITDASAPWSTPTAFIAPDQTVEDADARYNSGLFHFKKESERHEDPDELTLALDWMTSCSRNSARTLLPRMPVSILCFFRRHPGTVYEQFSALSFGSPTGTTRFPN